MRSLGIFAATHKPEVPGLLRQWVGLAEAHGIEVRLQPDAAALVGRAELGHDDDAVAATDALVTLSGDGGVLAAARAAVPHRTPILAVDLGRLGFLSTVHPSGSARAFELLRQGELLIEERMMLDTAVLRPRERGAGAASDRAPAAGASPASTTNGRTPFSTVGATVVGGSIGLNDAVVAKSALARILRLTIVVDGEVMAETRADGLVISTPTGSTAYALAAGGPIVHPAVPLMLLCPICAHSLTQRPLVIGPDETIEVLAEWEGDEVSSTELEAMLTVDGQVGLALQSGDIVRVRRAECLTRLLRLPDDSFYGRLREKMRWGR